MSDQQQPSSPSGDPVESRESPREPVVLRGISTRAWEHPADRGALVALRQLLGFDIVRGKHSGLMSVRALRLTFPASATRVDRPQYARVHEAYLSAAATP